MKKDYKAAPARNPVAKLAFAFNKAGIFTDKKKEQKKGKQKHKRADDEREFNR